jgi:hypothetical protein
VSQGGLFGEVSFFLQEPSTFSAEVTTQLAPLSPKEQEQQAESKLANAPAAAEEEKEQPRTIVHCLSRAALSRMGKENPRLAVALQTALLKSLTLQISDSLHCLAPSASVVE